MKEKGYHLNLKTRLLTPSPVCDGQIPGLFDDLELQITYISVEGVLILADANEGIDIINHAKTIAARFNAVFGGLPGVAIIFRHVDGWMGIDLGGTGTFTGFFDIFDSNMAAAMAEAMHFNQLVTHTAWAH